MVPVVLTGAYRTLLSTDWNSKRTILNSVNLSHLLKPYLEASTVEPWNGCEAKILETRGISEYWPIYLDSKMNLCHKYVLFENSPFQIRWLLRSHLIGIYTGFHAACECNASDEMVEKQINS